MQSAVFGALDAAVCDRKVHTRKCVSSSRLAARLAALSRCRRRVERAAALGDSGAKQLARGVPSLAVVFDVIFANPLLAHVATRLLTSLCCRHTSYQISQNTSSINDEDDEDDDDDKDAMQADTNVRRLFARVRCFLAGALHTVARTRSLRLVTSGSSLDTDLVNDAAALPPASWHRGCCTAHAVFFTPYMKPLDGAHHRGSTADNLRISDTSLLTAGTTAPPTRYSVAHIARLEANQRAAVHILTMCHDVLKFHRKHALSEEEYLIRPIHIALLETLAEPAAPGTGGTVPWIARAVYNADYIPADVLVFYLHVMVDLAKLNKFATSLKSLDPDEVSYGRICRIVKPVITYLRSQVPALGRLLAVNYAPVRRKTLALLRLLRGEDDLHYVILCMESTTTYLKTNSLQPEFSEWIAKEQYRASTLLLPPTIIADPESTKSVTLLIFENLAVFGKTLNERGALSLSRELVRIEKMLQDSCNLFRDALGSTQFSTYLFNLFTGNDEHLFDFLLAAQGLSAVSQPDSNFWRFIIEKNCSPLGFAIRSCDPNLMFLRLLNDVVGSDVSLLIDFIISTETKFLEYLLKQLSIITRDIQAFVDAGGISGILLCRQVFASMVKSLSKSMDSLLFNPTLLIRKLQGSIDAFNYVIKEKGGVYQAIQDLGPQAMA